MVTCRQLDDQFRQRAESRIELDDAGGILRTDCAAGALQRIGHEEATAVEVALEREPDRRSVQKGGTLARGHGCRGAKHAKRGSVLIENPDLREERVLSVRHRGVGLEEHRAVALARYSRTRLGHEDLEVAIVALERDTGGEVQARGEDFYLVAGGYDDVLSTAGVEDDLFARAGSIAEDHRTGERGGHEDPSERESNSNQLGRASDSVAHYLTSPGCNRNFSLRGRPGVASRRVARDPGRWIVRAELGWLRRR